MSSSPVQGVNIIFFQINFMSKFQMFGFYLYYFFYTFYFENRVISRPDNH